MKRIKLFDQSIDQKEFSAVKKTLESHFWASGSSSGNVGIFENSLNPSDLINEASTPSIDVPLIKPIAV